MQSVKKYQISFTEIQTFKQIPNYTEWKTKFQQISFFFSAIQSLKQIYKLLNEIQYKFETNIKLQN